MVNNDYIQPIYDFFINSHDFNGIPLQDLLKEWNVEQEEGVKILIALIAKGDCVIQSSNNPHIIHNSIPSPVKSIEFLEKILEKRNADGMFLSICVYPSEYFLKKHRDISDFSPYSKRLALGMPQLKPLFFKFEVLKPYVDNPNYDIKLDNYSGSLEYSLQEDTLVDKKGYYKLDTFGLGRDQNDNRVIVSFPRYLRHLSMSQQNHWEAHEITKPCRVLKYYMDNIMQGSWAFPQSISKGILNERSYVNNLWRAIFGEPLFKNEYSLNDLTREYSFIFIPTSKALNKFIHFMDKLFSDDMNTKHLRKLLEEGCENLPPVQAEYDPNIGSLKALELWMDNIYTLREGSKVGKEIVEPFKEIRKDRQLEAHKIITEDDYSLSYYEAQMNIFEKVYDALKKLQIILTSHPKAYNVVPPEDFQENVYLF